MSRIPSPDSVRTANHARDPVRGPLRDDDEMQGYMRAEEGERVRTLRGLQAIDPYFIPVELLGRYPDLSFEWKEHEIYGRPDELQRTSYEQQGWRAVPYRMFPELGLPGARGPIIRRDMVLMERPKHLTEQARAEEIALARQSERAYRERAQVTPDGQAPRMPTRMTQRVEPLEIPPDE
jgi:hypothetical protein